MIEYRCDKCGELAITDSTDDQGAPGAAYCAEHPKAMVTSVPVRARCQHPADMNSGATLLHECPDCGAECSRTDIGDDLLCYDEACPLHVLAGPGLG